MQTVWRSSFLGCPRDRSAATQNLPAAGPCQYCQALKTLWLAPSPGWTLMDTPSRRGARVGSSVRAMRFSSPLTVRSHLGFGAVKATRLEVVVDKSVERAERREPRRSGSVAHCVLVAAGIPGTDWRPIPIPAASPNRRNLDVEVVRLSRRGTR